MLYGGSRCVEDAELYPPTWRVTCFEHPSLFYMVTPISGFQVLFDTHLEVGTVNTLSEDLFFFKTLDYLLRNQNSRIRQILISKKGDSWGSTRTGVGCNIVSVSGGHAHSEIAASMLAIWTVLVGLAQAKSFLDRASTCLCACGGGTVIGINRGKGGDGAVRRPSWFAPNQQATLCWRHHSD
jgi:hypothetical protein